MRYMRQLRRRIEKLGPYPSLFLLIIPLAIVEPLKLATIFIAGEGHWITGMVALLGAYAVSLFVTHWLFGVVKPTLLTLPWFAACWTWLAAKWERARNWLLGCVSRRPLS
jgi:hypothetical protein